MGLSQYRLGKEVGVPAPRISEIVAGKRSITADTDLRLCKFCGLSNGYWLRAQAAHDTEVLNARWILCWKQSDHGPLSWPNKTLQPTAILAAAELRVVCKNNRYDHHEI
jgi:addiction module HigA family antidote